MTASSKSGHHYDHYKTICGNAYLVQLHMDSINLAENCGELLLCLWNGISFA